MTLIKEKKVEKIKLEFSFTSDFDLFEAIKYAHTAYQRALHIANKYQEKKSSRYFENVKNNIDNTLKSIEKMIHDEQVMTSKSGMDASQRAIESLKLFKFKLIFFGEIEQINKYSKIYNSIFIAKLIDCYTLGTGNEISYSYYPDNPDTPYTGPLVSFIEKTCLLCYVPIINSTIGDIIKNIKNHKNKTLPGTPIS